VYVEEVIVTSDNVNSERDVLPRIRVPIEKIGTK